MISYSTICDLFQCQFDITNIYAHTIIITRNHLNIKPVARMSNLACYFSSIPTMWVSVTLASPC